MMEMKYILVTGGVISGIGKGIIASSIGAILKHHGLKVTSIKIDPYINIDAGTFSPFEHGEVYVLDDGGEVDLDLGNYERYLDITLNSDNNITTGKIYSNVIANERKGDYLGKTVQVNPHITDAIQEWIERVARIPVDEDKSVPEVCIIELGGTIGDIEGMQFVEAFRKFQFKAKPENFCTVHVSLVPHTSSGEEKTKPTQVSVRELRRLGITPDFIVCRSARPVDSAIKQKIFDFCHVPPERVFCLPDVKNLYSVPMMLENQDASNLFSRRLHLGFPSIRPEDFMIKWRNIIKKQELATQTVKIALVGKYVKLEEAYASVTKALRHASIMCNRKLELKYIDAEDIEEGSKNQKSSKFFKAWHSVCEADGIIVPGGFGSRGLEGKISACNYARTHNIPFLGVCLGLQAAVIEFARNVMHWPDANSQEAVPEGTKHVVIEMPEHNPGIMGGTMRLGKRQTVFTASSAQSKIRKLYRNVDFIEERHRHRYEVNPQFVPDFREAGLQFVGEDETGQRMEIMELSDHPYYVACQFHPEYLSRPLKPSPPYVGLIFAASKKLDGYLAKTSQFTRLEYHDVIDEQLNAESIFNTSFQHISVNSNEN